MKVLFLTLCAIASWAQTSAFIACGNPSNYTDSTGQVWTADNGTNCSGGSTFHSGAAITGTSDPTLYQYGRIGNNVSASATLSVGVYNFRLKFADTQGFTVPGQQVFNIFINGTAQRTNFDIFAIVRAQNAAYDYVSFNFAMLQTGTATVLVSQVTGSAQLQAVSFTPQAASNWLTLANTPWVDARVYATGSSTCGINEADTALGSGQGTILLAAGICNAAAAISITHSLIGVSVGQTYIYRQFGGTSDLILQNCSGGDCSIGGFTTDNRVSSTGGYAVHQQNVDFGVIRDISIIGSFSGVGGIFVDSVVRSTVSHISIIENLTHGLKISASGPLITNMDQSISGTGAVNVECTSGGFVMTNFGLQNTGSSGVGILIDPTGVNTCAESIASSGEIDSAPGVGIQVVPQNSGETFNVKFADIYITKVTDAQAVVTNQYASGVDFENIKILSQGGSPVANNVIGTIAGNNISFDNFKVVYSSTISGSTYGLVLTGSPVNIAIRNASIGTDYLTGAAASGLIASILSEAGGPVGLTVANSYLNGSTAGLQSTSTGSSWSISGNTFPSHSVVLSGSETKVMYVNNLAPTTFASLFACGSGSEGSNAVVSDSSTSTWGATITGLSTSHVLAYCDGTNWTVAAK